MKAEVRSFIVIGIIVAALVGVFVVMRHRSSLSASNPPEAVGNTAGNLYNKGYMCESSDGIVYFSNPYDSGRLYSMKSDQSDIKRLNTSSIYYLNTYGNKVYYSLVTGDSDAGVGIVLHFKGLYASDRNGKNAVSIADEKTFKTSMVGNYLFTETYSKSEAQKLLKVKIDKSETTEIKDSRIDPCGVAPGSIYHPSTSDLSLCKLDVESGQDSVVSHVKVWRPIYDGGSIYFLSPADDYKVAALGTDGSAVVLTEEGADCYNMLNGTIFYNTINTDSPALMRRNPDGSTDRIYEGNCTDIQMTSTYTYFREYGTEVPVYMTPTTGAASVKPFSAAQEAALKFIKEE